MKVSYEIHRRQINFLIDASPDEKIGIGQMGKEIQLVSDNFRVKLPVDVESPHPDILALCAITTLQPFMGPSVGFSLPVSAPFADIVKRVFGVSVTTVNKSLAPRGFGNNPALAFSSGVDSVAASAILPENTAKITYVRMDHQDVAPRRDNFRDTTIESVSHFKETILVESDLEYICGPFLQWATWPAVTVPIFLLADNLKLGGVAFGHIFNSWALSEETDGRYMEDDWLPLYKAVGLDILLPTCGLTEVGTMLVAAKSGNVDKATSCQLGQYQQPCHECLKCFRKDLLLSYAGIVSSKDVNSRIDKYMDSNMVINGALLATLPIHMQEVYMLPLSRDSKLGRESEVFRLFRKKVELPNTAGVSLEWIAKHNDKELRRNTENPNLLNIMEANISRYVDNMEDIDYRQEERLDLLDFYLQPKNASKVSDIDKKIRTLLGDSRLT